jgi:hypothetical protein
MDRPRRGQILTAPAGLITAPASFLAHVVEDPAFRSHGLALGFEHGRGMRLHWAVVDPDRHTLFVWRKRVTSYPAAARGLSASVVTSGPFTNYPGGDFRGSAKRFALAVARRTESLRDLEVTHFEAPAPLGSVIGTHEAIEERGVPRPGLHHLGRGSGTAFGDYVIGQGEPSGLAEAIGGLFRCVRAYEPYTVRQFTRVGFWGLAPFDDPELRRAGLEGDRQGGLILFVGGWANTLRLATLLCAVRVRDAVQVDGGDSLLLGSGRDLRIGEWMPRWKRLLQCWGIQFQPARR